MNIILNRGIYHSFWNSSTQFSSLKKSKRISLGFTYKRTFFKSAFVESKRYSDSNYNNFVGNSINYDDDIDDDELLEEILTSNSSKQIDIEKTFYDTSSRTPEIANVDANNLKLTQLIENENYEEADIFYQSIVIEEKHNTTDLPVIDSITHRLAIYLYFISGKKSKAIDICKFMFTKRNEIFQSFIMVLKLIGEGKLKKDDDIKELIQLWWTNIDNLINKQEFKLDPSIFDEIVIMFSKLGYFEDLYEIFDNLSERRAFPKEEQLNILLEHILKSEHCDESFCRRIYQLMCSNHELPKSSLDLLIQICEKNGDSYSPHFVNQLKIVREIRNPKPVDQDSKRKALKKIISKWKQSSEEINITRELYNLCEEYKMKKNDDEKYVLYPMTRFILYNSDLDKFVYDMDNSWIYDQENQVYININNNNIKYSVKDFDSLVYSICTKVGLKMYKEKLPNNARYKFVSKLGEI